jgi:predicted aspartyl protease
MESFDGHALPAAYLILYDQWVGDKFVARVEIRLDSAVKTMATDATYQRRYYFTELHDNVVAVRSTSRTQRVPATGDVVENVPVDTGAELSWIPASILESLGIERFATLRFRQANGTIVERWVGPAFIHAVGKRTTDDVIFWRAGRSRAARCAVARRVESASGAGDSTTG